MNLNISNSKYIIRTFHHFSGVFVAPPPIAFNIVASSTSIALLRRLASAPATRHLARSSWASMNSSNLHLCSDEIRA